MSALSVTETGLLPVPGRKNLRQPSVVGLNHRILQLDENLEVVLLNFLAKLLITFQRGLSLPPPVLSIAPGRRNS